MMFDAFSAMVGTLFADPNFGIDIVYRPETGGAISCPAVFAEPDEDQTFGQTRLKNRKRVLIVRMSDIPSPKKTADIEIPAGGTTYRVVDFSSPDANRTVWKIEVAEK